MPDDLSASRLLARTVRIPDPGPLSALVGHDLSTSAFLRGSDGVVGFGEVARLNTRSMADADQWWRSLCAGMDISSQLPPAPGVGPIAFGTFLFDPLSSRQLSTMLVPRIVIGRRGDLCWQTTLSTDDSPADGSPADVPPASSPAQQPGQLSWADGAVPGPVWEGVVADVVRRLDAGEADKVVLARDLLVRSELGIDPAWLVSRLHQEYPDTWTFLVDGLVGATPELLIDRHEGRVLSRVLAGTIRRADGTEGEVAGLRERLMNSHKDRYEHDLAARSVGDALQGAVSDLSVPEEPYVLELPNVLHLATDVTASASGSLSSLALTDALHPTSAVCGTPRESARTIIADVEQLDRGRYAGPVGWIDAAGDGVWALALRCGQLNRTDRHEIQLFAGGGIVPESVPEDELLETVAKFVPMRDALS